MAAVTVDRVRSSVFGNRRVVTATIDIAADTDTWAVPGMRFIEHASLTSQTNAAIGYTKSGGTLTLQTGGVENNVDALVVGF